MALSTYLVALVIFSFLMGVTRLIGIKRENVLYTDAVSVIVVAGIFMLKKYMSGGRYSGTESINGKTVIITGANSGIGFETAKELARRGGRIIMACRDINKGENARRDIQEQTGNNNVLLKKLDLASFASIKAFCKDINESESHIDILINNAAVMMCPKMLTEDGIEMQLGVNHIGHFLLSQELLDKMKASAPSRIIIVSSLAHKYGKINFDDLNSAKCYHRFQAYYNSKLANVLHARQLAKRLQGTGVTVNSLNPGPVNTNLARHVPFVDTTVWGRLLMVPVRYILFKTPVQGIQTVVRLAVDTTLETVTGQYFSDCETITPAPQAEDDETARRLWDISEDWIKGSIQ